MEAIDLDVDDFMKGPGVGGPLGLEPLSRRQISHLAILGTYVASRWSNRRTLPTFDDQLAERLAVIRLPTSLTDRFTHAQIRDAKRRAVDEMPRRGWGYVLIAAVLYVRYELCVTEATKTEVADVLEKVLAEFLSLLLLGGDGWGAAAHAVGKWAREIGNVLAKAIREMISCKAITNRPTPEDEEKLGIMPVGSITPVESTVRQRLDRLRKTSWYADIFSLDFWLPGSTKPMKTAIKAIEEERKK